MKTLASKTTASFRYKFWRSAWMIFVKIFGEKLFICSNLQLRSENVEFVLRYKFIFLQYLAIAIFDFELKFTLHQSSRSFLSLNLAIRKHWNRKFETNISFNLQKLRSEITIIWKLDLQLCFDREVIRRWNVLVFRFLFYIIPSDIHTQTGYSWVIKKDSWKKKINCFTAKYNSIFRINYFLIDFMVNKLALDCSILAIVML